MKSWNDFNTEQTELAEHGERMLFRTREHVGHAFLATLRKNGAPRLHPIDLILSHGHAYVITPRALTLPASLWVGEVKRNVVIKKQMSCECRPHAVVILSPIPIMGVEF